MDSAARTGSPLLDSLRRARESAFCRWLLAAYFKHQTRCNFLAACFVVLAVLMLVLLLPSLGSDGKSYGRHRYRERSECATHFHIPERYVHNVGKITHLLTLGDSSSYNSTLHSWKGAYWNEAIRSIEKISRIHVTVGHVENASAGPSDLSGQLNYYLKEHGSHSGDAGLAVFLVLSLDKWVQDSKGILLPMSSIMKSVQVAFQELEEMLHSAKQDKQFGQGLYLYLILPPDPTDGMAWMPTELQRRCQSLYREHTEWMGTMLDVDLLLNAISVEVAAHGFALLDLHEIFLGHGKNAALTFGMNYYTHGDAEPWLIQDSCYQLSEAGHLALNSLFMTAVTQKPRSGC